MPTNQIINDVIPWTQSIASSGQTVFDTNWTAAYASDINVYKRASDQKPDEQTQLVSTNQYNVSFVGTYQVVRVIFIAGVLDGDIITIVRDTPVDRMNLYTNTNFVPSMLNQDTALLTLVDQERQMANAQSVKYHLTDLNPNLEPIQNPPVPHLGPNQIWAMDPNGNEIIAYDVPESGGVAPKQAKYIVQTQDKEVPNAIPLDSKPSGFLVNTSGSGLNTARTLISVNNQTKVTEGEGQTGNPTIGLADNIEIPGTEGFTPPTGTSIQRPSVPKNGEIRFNTDLGALEAWFSGAWNIIPSSGDISAILALYASHNVGQGSSLIGLQNQGSVTNKTAQDLANSSFLSKTDDGTLENGVFLSDLPSGFMSSETGTGELNSRIHTGTLNQIDVTDGNGLSGNPTYKLPDELIIPGTFKIQSSTQIDEIINDDTFNTAADTNLATALSTKNYINTVVSGFHWVNPCDAGSTSNYDAAYDNGASGIGATLTANTNGAFTLDGISGLQDAPYLFQHQTNSYENGIYTLYQVGSISTPAILVRADYFNSPENINAGDLVPVTSGTINGGTLWMQTNKVTNVGVDSITFIEFSVVPANMVTTNTAQTISGAKTFTNPLNVIDGESIFGDSRTINTNKFFRFSIPVYDNSGKFSGVLLSATDTSNAVFIGGGSSASIAATEVNVFAAANRTTPIGTRIADFNINGFRLGANSRVTTILNENNMASNSPNALATQSSIKAYVDSFQESGVFTPIFDFTTPGNLSFAYTSQTGYYRIVGKLIFIKYNITGTPTFTTSSGNLIIRGLPFASANSRGSSSGSSYNAGSTLIYGASGFTSLIGQVGPSGTVLVLTALGSAQAATNLTTSSFTSGALIQFGGSLIYELN